MTAKIRVDFFVPFLGFPCLFRERVREGDSLRFWGKKEWERNQATRVLRARGDERDQVRLRGTHMRERALREGFERGLRERAAPFQ